MYKYKSSLTKIEAFYINDLLNGINRRFVDLYSCPAIGNYMSVTQKVHDVRYRKQI